MPTLDSFACISYQNVSGDYVAGTCLNSMARHITTTLCARKSYGWKQTNESKGGGGDDTFVGNHQLSW